MLAAIRSGAGAASLRKTSDRDTKVREARPSLLAGGSNTDMMMAALRHKIASRRSSLDATSPNKKGLARDDGSDDDDDDAYAD